VKLNYTPILDLLQQNGVKFDKISEGKNLLQFAYENKALYSVNLLLSYDEFFDDKLVDKDQLNQNLQIAKLMIDDGKIEAIKFTINNRRIKFPNSLMEMLNQDS
jgi:hypothetical protein